MKVLLVSHYYLPHVGGLEMVVKQSAKSFIEAGHNVSLVTCAAAGETPGTINENGLILYRLPAINFFDKHFGIPFPIGGFSLISRLYKEIKNADVIQLHDVFYQTSWLTYIITRWQRKPIILTQHVGIVKHPNKIVTLIQKIMYATWGKLIFSYSQRIIVYNDNVKTFLLNHGVNSSKILEIRNGIDLSIFRPADIQEKLALRSYFNLPREKPLVLFVGRFVPKKGFTALLNARSSEYDMVFAGSGEIKKDWHSLPGIHFIGPLNQKEIAKLYRVADIFALPAHGEIFTLAMQEAMASGLPTITTNDPGYQKYKINRNLILFLEPTPEELRKNIQRIIANKSLLDKMSSYSLDIANQWFSWKANVKPVLNLISTQ